ncbi:MAG: 2-oxoacid:ferredoxin oxidoreductase subunit beta [Alphaproteobacteria bacterium]
MSDTLDQAVPSAPERTAPGRTAKDFAADMEVRWCPGCGDYAILKAVQKTLADLAADPDRTVFLSGIGCAARFPYYVDTYGFHTIHGRAAAIATGVKLSRPDLDVWVVSGDGDSLSIGGNHLLHLLRRNVDLVYLLFNNEVYGLTKGQASPTSPVGQVTPSTPAGSLDEPVHAGRYVLGCGGSFFARVPDVAQAQLVEVMKAAHAHAGTGFVEILQNCIVYHDGAWSAVTDKKTAADRQLWCRHGEPLRFGEGGAKALRLNPAALALEVFTPGVDGAAEEILVHDATNPMLARLLCELDAPLALGVIHRRDAAVLERRHHAARPAQRRDARSLQALLNGTDTWTL